MGTNYNLSNPIFILKSIFQYCFRRNYLLFTVSSSHRILYMKLFQLYQIKQGKTVHKTAKERQTDKGINEMMYKPKYDK